MNQQEAGMFMSTFTTGFSVKPFECLEKCWIYLIHYYSTSLLTLNSDFIPLLCSVDLMTYTALQFGPRAVPLDLDG